MSTNAEIFIEHIRQKLGYVPPAGSIVPGKFIRFPTVGEGRPGYAKLFPDGNGGIFGDFRQDLNEIWQAHEPRTPEERGKFKRQIEQAKGEAEKRREAEHVEALPAIEKTWQRAKIADQYHAYLNRKNVKTYSIRRDKEDLLVPVFNIERTLHGLQRIGPDGSKQFQKGSWIKGNFFTLGTVKDKLLICEGYATAATIHEITGQAVVIAFNVGNLKPVAEILRSKYPDALLIICADDDHQTEGNPGLTKGTEAALAVNGLLAIPVFPDNRGPKDTDFNDLARLAGPEAVNACIEATVIPTPSTAQNNTSQAHESQESLEAVIKRLAPLSPLQYDRVRKTEAEALGVRPGTLDTAVKATRKGKDNDGLPFIVDDPCPEPVDPAKLLTDIATTIRRFIVCTTEVSHAVALWIAMTWFIDVVQVAPLAVITAPEKRCGKTLLLSLLGRLSARAITASSISPAALFRTIDKWQPTLLIDEADAFMKDNEELRGLLNSGHTRDSACVLRIVGDNFTPTKFITWGAKALSGIGRVADTLRDRAVILELRRKLPHEKVDRIRHADPALFNHLRSKLARFAEDYSEKVQQARPPLPDSLNDREQDNWEPLLAIAMIAGNDWLQIGTTAALKLSGGESASQTIGTELLSDIQEIFEEKQIDRISTAELIKALCTDEEKNWATYYRGLPITPRQLAKILDGYSIHSKSIRVGLNETPKGFELHQFKDAFSRYISPENMRHTPQPAPVKDLQDFPSATQEVDVADRNRRKPTPAKDCGVVADKTEVRRVYQEDLFDDAVPEAKKPGPDMGVNNYVEV